MNPALRDIEVLRDFAERKLRRTTSEKEQLMHASYKRACEAAIKIIKKYEED